VYYQGCLWGGKVPDVLEMIEELESRVNEDLKNNVIAVWHDESHMNKYFIENKKFWYILLVQNMLIRKCFLSIVIFNQRLYTLQKITPNISNRNGQK
jgi:hypothetical protein